MKRFMIAVIFVFLSGCATVPPAKYNFDLHRDYSKTYDEVWSSIIEYFANTNTPIKTVEKVSGIIVSDDMKIPFQPTVGTIQSIYCDCGTPGGFFYYKELLGNYNVFVKKVTDNETSVQINTNYKTQLWLTNNFQGWTNCPSTGLLESGLYAYLEQQLKIAKGGIGVGFKNNVIIAVFENSPAKAAGLMVNDKIVAINNTPIKSQAEILFLLRGEENSEVNLTILREDNQLNFTIHRYLYTP